MNDMTLLVINGPNLGRSTVVSTGGSLVVGRIRSSGFAIMDARMSREHFVLFSEDGRWLLRDLDSTNGTLVNAQKVEESTIQHGDVISAGDTCFRVILGQPDTAIETESTSESHHDGEEETSCQRTWTEPPCSPLDTPSESRQWPNPENE